MRLTSLALRDWRNTTSARLDTDARFVVLHGDNGQGKTNLLEAVYVLATLRSFRESRPRRWVRHGCDAAEIRATSVGPAGTRALTWRWAGGRRELEMDGARPSALVEWFAAVRAVLFSPEDAGIVRGEPELRRRFLDRAEFTARPDYLDLARAYRRVVQQKAALLRGSPRRAELDPWNARLADLGARVALRRRRIVAELEPAFVAMHQSIAGPRAAGAVRLEVRGVGAGSVDEPHDQVRARLAEAVVGAMDDELRRQRVLVGPHRDDLGIFLDGRSARTFASQGQARTLVLSLKLAELDAARERGDAPMFLLDDLTSELDAGRMGRLVAVLEALESQVWVTTTDPRHLGPLPEGAAVHHEVDAGQVR